VVHVTNGGRRSVARNSVAIVKSSMNPRRLQREHGGDDHREQSGRARGFVGTPGVLLVTEFEGVPRSYHRCIQGNLARDDIVEE
jgi:hypothetical protein